MTWIIKRTTTETFEVNVNALDPYYMAGTTETLDRVLGMVGGLVAQNAENWIIEQFELHDGSIFGDKLFSSMADLGVGYELALEED